jgi:hypothetical protein
MTVNVSSKEYLQVLQTYIKDNPEISIFLYS